MLKTAVQSQLDGVRTGLVQLHNALQDVKDIKQSLEEAESTHHGINDLQNSLKKVREENSRHSQVTTQECGSKIAIKTTVYVLYMYILHIF